MSDIAGIAGNAVAVYQQALTTVSNNIANVSTEGYSRQDVALSALPVTKAGSVFLGSGVGMDRVKRQYDQFVESNLRNTTSDLAAQGPVVDYANRVVDVMGSQSMGLNTALDAFFSSARNLAADPSSTVLRSSFVRDAGAVTDRFGQLSSQLDLVEDQTQQQLDNAVGQINALTSQIAQVNAQLSKQALEVNQPPDLLDQRDLLLKKLSEFVRVNTRFEVNGQVSVSIGQSITQDVVVSNQKAFNIGSNYSAAASGKVALVLDPYGTPQPLTGITSGSLAGLMTFREQVLGSTRNSLDNLARTFANEVNSTHKQGVDGYGNLGQDLLKFDPSASTAAGGIRVAFSDPMLVAAASQFRVIEGANNPSKTDATLRYLDPAAPSVPGAVQPSPPAGPKPIQSLLVNNDNASAAKLISVSASLPLSAVAAVQQGMTDVSVYLDSMQAGQQLQVMTRDGRQLIGPRITDAAQFLTTDNGFAQGATYSDQYANQSGASGYRGMTVFYGAQAAPQMQATYKPDGTASATGKYFPAILQGERIAPASTATLPAPVIGGDFFASNAGVQIGNTLVIPHTGFPVLQAGSTKTFQLGPQGAAGFSFNSATTAQDVADAINSHSNSINYTASVDVAGNLTITNRGFPAGSFTLNGVDLGALSFPPDDSNLKPGQVAAWINAKVGRTGVTAQASNTIVVDPAQVKFGLPLYINGTGINTATTVTLPALADAINNAAAGVSATVDANGKLVLRNSGASLGDEITISANTVAGSSGQNALGLTSGVYRGTLALSQPAADTASVSASNLNFSNPLCINGVQISNGAAGDPHSALALADAINAVRDQTNVQARLSADQSTLIISNVAGAQGATISVSRTPLQADTKPGTYIAQGANALGLANGVIADKETPNLAAIQLGFGTGTPADLLKLGFRTGAFIKGSVKDDLLVFVSGAGAAMVSASYAGKPADPRQSLRASPMLVTFTDDTHYKIQTIDKVNGTTLTTTVAQRVLDPQQLNPGIVYQGLSLSFTSPPKASDTFTLDGNSDGIGNNDNMLAVSALETKAVVGQKTLANAYIDQINEMGNIARQASISQTALTVVHDQAVKSRDTTAGVSLDQEAADLIRYQQAYQASAKTLQIAGQLFDAVLHVN